MCTYPPCCGASYTHITHAHTHTYHMHTPLHMHTYQLHTHTITLHMHTYQLHMHTHVTCTHHYTCTRVQCCIDLKEGVLRVGTTSSVAPFLTEKDLQDKMHLLEQQAVQLFLTPLMCAYICVCVCMCACMCVCVLCVVDTTHGR